MYYDEEPKLKSSAPRMADGITGPVIVPFLQAVITGALLGIASGVAVSLIDLQVSGWKVAVLVWTGGTLASWLMYRSRWQYVIENILGVDVNHDGYIGEPEPELRELPPLHIMVTDERTGAGVFANLPHPDKVIELAPALADGRIKFSQEAVNHVLKRQAYLDVRTELLKRGLAYWKVPGAETQGVELTTAGRAVMRRIAQEYGNQPPALLSGK